MELQGKLLNVLGDSITEGVGASAVENRYTDVLARTFHCRVNNYGISGTRISRQSVITDDPCDNDFCLRVSQMDTAADGVVVFGGTNDYGHGDAPLGQPGDRTPYSFWGACHYLMDSLLTLYPGKPVLIVTPLHRDGEDNPYGSHGGNKAVATGPLRVYRDILVAVAQHYALPVLDLYATSGIQPENPTVRSLLLPDGLHPSDAGHALIARRIGYALQQL